MEKIQQHKRMVNTNTKWIELYLYNYIIIKNIDDNTDELKLVTVIQYINQNIYDLKEDDFKWNIYTIIEKVTKVFDKNIAELSDFYEIKPSNIFTADDFFLFEDELCENCLENWSTHLMVRTLKIREVLFFNWLILEIDNWVVSIYINTKTPKITTCILNKETWLIEYEILVYKHNCGDNDCENNNKIVLTIKEFYYSWREFEDKMELIKNYWEITNYVVKEVLLDNPKDIEKELLMNINKIVRKKEFLISKWDWKSDIKESVFLPKFEIDLNLWS